MCGECSSALHFLLGQRRYTAGMCGRFTRDLSIAVFADAVGVSTPPDLLAKFDHEHPPRWNIAPSQTALVIRLDDAGDVEISARLWTFPTSRGPRINVRTETAHRVPEYAPLFDQQRCLVLASGFYEPEGAKTVKHRPWWYFRPKGSTPLLLGGILGAAGFSILTRAPLDPVARVHDRSPVLVPTENGIAWLSPEITGQEALAAYAPPEAGAALDAWRVSDAAKNPGNEGQRLIEPFDDGNIEQMGLF